MSDGTGRAKGLGLRKALRGLLNHMGRAARVGNYWYWVDPPELRAGVSIASLVCPLRYDVLVRADFLAFYAANRALYAADFGAFLDLARRGTYYRWFIGSEAVRTKREILGSSAAIEAAFADRVRRAARLHDSVAAGGFSTRRPILLKTAERLLPPTADRRAPPTGKRVEGRYFLADGCHRLALLIARGYAELSPGFFRVMCFRAFSPFDSTSLLARSLPIAPADYFRFLSMRYCAPHVFAEGCDVVGYVEEHRPELLDELLSAIHVDGFDVSAARTSSEHSG